MNTKEAKEPIYRSDLLYRSGTTPQQAKGEQPAPAADERAAFEAWALARPLAIRSDLNRMDGGDYWLPTMERMWEAWQARASAPAPTGDAATHVPYDKCVLGHCGSPSGCERDEICRASLPGDAPK